jgi:alkanesulfonate monooxygenase SsuD/methylene tetrahydromethanopterin reductase-like flavin-dependent oxidoreductase (luciferase family)
MDVGIGLPATIPGTSGSLVLDWAGRTDSGPFSRLGIIDRLVYTKYEPLVTLPAAAAVAERVRLTTTILPARCARRECWPSRRPPSTCCREAA